MKLLGALVCAATLVCVTSSPRPDEPDLSRAATCRFNPICDSTGEESIPIPCDGYCQKYFFCKDGKPRLKDCEGGENFNNIDRKCDSGFKDCDWWKDKTTPNTDNPTNSPDETTVSSISPNTEATTPPGTTITEGPCSARADCDATGEEKKPIPCANFCNKYYNCKDGSFTIETCEKGNFDNVKRTCSESFKNCDWYKQIASTSPQTQPTTPPPTQRPSTGTSISGPATTPAGTISSTTQRSGQAKTVCKPTTSLILTVVIPLLSRFL